MESKFENAPRIGMGCWAIGGAFWRGDQAVGYSGTNDADSLQAIEASWEAGIRVFDTSAVYGAGHSEALLGKALGTRSDAIIVSKFGNAFDASTKQMTGSQYDPAYIKDSVEQSRSRLCRDQIDVMLLHLNDLSIEESLPVFETLDGLRSRGHIASYGWSTDYAASIDAVAGQEGFTTVQHAMNVYFDATSLSAVADSHDLVKLIRSPLAMGVLTGSFSKGRRIGKDDIRSEEANWQGYFDNGEASAQCLKQLDAVRELLTVGGRTLAQGALCWLLAKSANNVPIPGAKNAEQAQQNAAALEFGPLPADIMETIETVIDRPPEGQNRAR